MQHTNKFNAPNLTVYVVSEIIDTIEGILRQQDPANMSAELWKEWAAWQDALVRLKSRG